MKRLFALSVILFLSWFLSPSQAAKVKVWQQHGASHFDKAKLQGAVITSEGVVRLSRQLKPLATLNVAHVWDVVEDAQGNLYAATGNEGKLFKITPDGKSTVVYSSKDGQVLSLALGMDGAVFAGTGPTGKIVRVGPDGQAKVVAEGLGSYVWTLAYNPKTKNMFAGTGPLGQIFMLPPEAAPQPRLFYKTKQDHVLRLAIGPNEEVFAGADKGGLVYRIDKNGKGFVVYQAPQAEVRSLLVQGDTLFAGTSTPSGKRNFGGGRPTSGGPGGDGLFIGPPSGALSGKPDKTPAQVGGSPAGGSGEGKENPAPASNQPPPTVGDNSIYRIAADGTVREIFRDKVMVLGLLRQGSKLLAGTGMQGQLFEIDEASKERSEVARLDHGQIHCLLQRKDGSIVLGTGDPGKLYTLEDNFAAKGNVLSEVLDARIVSTWGHLTWKAQTPAGTNVTLAFRSGNVAEPDETWSAWSAEQSEPADARVLAPTARFLQYRVTLTSTDPKLSPELQHLAVRYKTTNQAPELTSLEVPNLDAVNLDNRKIKVRWSAIDPNEDELTYSIFVRKEGWKEWVQLEDDYEKKEFDWDTATIPSGVYQVKVVASDRRDNAPENALTAEKISAPIPVAHEPPRVTVKLAGFDGDQAILEASATDAMVRLTEASFAVSGKRWTNVFPTDGIFDSKTETFRFKTDPLRPGTHVLVLRVRDAAGNIGSGDVLFAIKK